MNAIPRIQSVSVIAPLTLLVEFTNTEKRMYDCSQALQCNPQFSLLKDKAFFNAVKVDAGGYGISWNDDLDLSEYEIWTNGREC